MIDRDRWRQSRALAMHRLRRLHARLDRICARMNSALVAVAVVLAVAVFATAALRVPEFLAQQLDMPKADAPLDD